MSDSSDDNQKPQILTAEYKDGQLQIVEVTPFERDRTESLTELSCSGSSKQYMQVIDGDKGLVQFDLLNLTLVRSQDGEESYQLLANDCEGEGSENAVTCVLQTSDTEDRDNQEYVMVDSDNGQGPLFFLQSALPQVNSQQKKDETQVVHVTQKKVPSATEILEKAKALQKVKATIAQAAPRRRGRKRKSDLPPPHELLASPNFKLFLYACKMCPFKCNSIKEMSEHKAAIHGAARARGGGRGAAVTLQCARCPLLADTHTQLAKHVQEAHCTTAPETIRLNTEEVEAADVLVCGACGFESSSRHDFRRHIEDEHGVNTC